MFTSMYSFLSDEERILLFGYVFNLFYATSLQSYHQVLTDRVFDLYGVVKVGIDNTNTCN